MCAVIHFYMLTCLFVFRTLEEISTKKGKQVKGVGFTEKTSFWPRLLVSYITANGWLATASHMMKMKKNKRLLTYSFELHLPVHTFQPIKLK